MTLPPEINKIKYFRQPWTKINGKTAKFAGKIAFPWYTESVKFRSQSRETASKRKPYRGLGTRYPST